jgi:hypothetical protein
MAQEVLAVVSVVAPAGQAVQLVATFLPAV